MLYNLNLRVLELMSKYTEIITTLLLRNCWVFMWFQGLLPGKQTVLRVSDLQLLLANSWRVNCYVLAKLHIWPENYHWELLTLDNIQLFGLKGINTWKHVQGCMLTDTMHLGIIQISKVMTIVGIKICCKSQYGCCKKMEKNRRGLQFQN